MSLHAIPRRYLASAVLVVAVHAIVLARLLQAPPQVFLPPQVIVVDMDVALPGPPVPAAPEVLAEAAETAPAQVQPPPAAALATPAARPPAPAPAAAAERPAPAADAADATAEPSAGGTDGLRAPAPDAVAGAALPAPDTAYVPPRLVPGGAGNPRPPYPALSRSLGERGVVELKLRVEADGRVSDVQLVRTSGHRRLDNSALHTVRRWVLRPALQGGRPVPAWLPHNVEFNLEN